MSSKTPDRRQFLKRLTAAAYVAPVFVSAGAHAEKSPYERATQLLDKTRDFVLQARRAKSQEASMEALKVASTELRLARKDIRRVKGDQVRSLEARVRNLSTEIRQAGGNPR